MAKKNSGIEIRNWMASLKTAEPERLYVFYGEERYRLDLAVDMIKKRAVMEGTEDFNLSELDGAKTSEQEFIEACESPPMLGGRRVVIIHDFPLFKGENDRIIEMLENLDESACIIFVFDKPDFSPDKRTKMYKLIDKLGKCVNFEHASEEELEGFLVRLFERRGRRLSRADAQYMISVCGTDMQTLTNETVKVASYAKEVNIKKSDIDAVATRALESKVFDLTDDIANGRTARALARLSDLERLSESPIMITALIGRQFRQIYLAKCAQNENRTGYIMNDLGLRYSFQLDKIMDAARRYTVKRVREIIAECEKCDFELKSGGDYDTLKLFILKCI